jgi:hypothetical protein
LHTILPYFYVLYAPNLALRGVFGLDLQNLTTTVCTADGADVVRQAGVMALRAVYQVEGFDVIVTASIVAMLT